MDPVSVCNIALGALGQDRISSSAFEDPDEAASELCSTFFDPCLRACLEDIAPLFATGFIDLGAGQASEYASLITAPSGLSGRLLLTKKFDLPKTVIRPLEYDDGSGTFSIKCEREGRAVLAEETDRLLIKAILYTPDPNTWDPNFVFAVGYNLASTIAGPLTHKPALKKEMLDEYESYKRKAGNLSALGSNITKTIQARGPHALKHRR